MPVTWGPEVSVRVVGRTVHAGFPSPADDFLEEMIDLNRELIPNPVSSFLWRVVGDCMIDVRIFPGDVVVVDRSLQGKHRSIVLVMVDGEPTLKRMNRRGGALLLHNENARLPAFTVAPGTEISVWGVVTTTIRNLKS